VDTTSAAGRIAGFGGTSTVYRPNVFRFQLAGAEVFSLDRLVDFPTMYGNFGRRVDPQAYFLAPDIYNCHNDIVTYDNALVALPGQDKHQGLLPS